LGVALVGALVYHVVAQMTGHVENWFHLAMVTVDIAILFTIGLFTAGAPRAARQRSPDGRGAQRHW